MLFNSYQFLFAFLPAVLAAFYLLPRHRVRLLLVIAASYYFYAYAKWWFPLLMAATTAISFSASLAISRAASARRKRLALCAGIVGVLSLLGYFKYAAFVAGYGTDFLGLFSSQGFSGVHAFTARIVLPLGVSFFSFEAISYMVDVYRGDLAVERNLVRYTFFISFFPHLIAGPIVRYGKLRPQLERLQRFDVDEFRSGLLLFSLGLVKKTMLADGLAHWVNLSLGAPSSLGFVDSWAAAIGFGFQIYFDFSAYSDMALGLARMLGIELPWNFDRPYRSASPREFWRRWHVTLSTWLRDYLYIPLRGNRTSPARRDANLLLTMALGGLWHGAALNFVIWGLYHGMLLVGNRHAERLPVRLPRPLAVLVTFLLVTVGWVFFRMRNATGIGSVLSGMVGLNGVGQAHGHLLLYLAVGAAIIWGLPEEWRWQLAGWRAPRVAALAVAAALAVMSIYGSHPFIYFRF